MKYSGVLRPYWGTPPFITHILLMTQLHSVAVHLSFRRRYKMLSLYLSPVCPISHDDLDYVVRQHLPPLLFPRDINPHIPLWRDTVTSLNTPFLISLVNNEIPTHLHCQTSSFSSNDQSFLSLFFFCSFFPSVIPSAFLPC